VTESGGRYTQLRGGPGEAAAAGDEEESLEVIEFSRAITEVLSQVHAHSVS
jgi:hypothetical protein